MLNLTKRHTMIRSESASTTACNTKVAVQHAGAVVKYVVEELTGKMLAEVPSKATVARMAAEMGIASEIHVGGVLHATTDATLGWDATCIEGVHVNEVHIRTATGGDLTLGISELPAGRTQD